MNEVLLDQIPSLIDLQRYLEQLSIMEPPAIKKDIILEQVNSFGQQFLLKTGQKVFFFLIQSNLRSACGIATIATISLPVSLFSSSPSYFRRIEWHEIDLGSRLP